MLEQMHHFIFHYFSANSTSIELNTYFHPST